MKRKYFLRGLGIGILFASLVLCIGYRKQNSEKTVVERARELGMEFPERTPDTLLISSGSAVGTTSGPALTPEQRVTALPTGTPSPAPTAEATDQVTPTAKATDKTVTPIAQETAQITKAPTAKPTTGTTKNTRTFTVRGGLLSSSVAREMKQAGIIKDADAFDKYLEKSGMARKIRAGQYKIPVGASYEEITRIITRQD